jgi:predicted enzyme related to lactoylglutathione lyase
VPSQAVLYVRGLDALEAFYRECVGLTPGETGEGYCELRADGLVLWLIRGQQPPATDTDGTIRRRSEVPVKLCFEVLSIERVAGAITASGGTVAKTSWDFAGYRRRDATDPEGNVIQLLEPLTTPGNPAG